MLAVAALSAQAAGYTATCRLTIVLYDSSGQLPLAENGTLPRVALRRLGSTTRLEREATLAGSNVTCTFSGLEPGDYEVAVLWRGIEVYHIANYTLSGNVTLTLRCNASLAYLRLVDGLGRPLPRAKIHLMHQGELKEVGTLTSDEEGVVRCILPFGAYSVSKAEVVVGGLYVQAQPALAVTVKVSGDGAVVLAPDSPPSDTMALSVYPAVIKLLTANGNPLPPSAISHIRAVLRAEEGIAQLSINGSVVRIDQLPKGAYTISFFWEDYLFYELLLNHVSGITNRTVSITVVEDVCVTLCDEAGNPLANASVVVETPWGEGLNYTSNSKGEVRLGCLPQGTYTIKVTYGSGRRAERQLQLGRQSRYRVTLEEFVTILLNFKREGGEGGLPEGLRVRVSLDHEVREYVVGGANDTVWLRTIPAGWLHVVVVWQNVTVAEVRERVVSSRPIEVRCSIWDLKLVFKDMDGEGVEGLELMLVCANGTRRYLRTGEGGELVLRALPGGTYYIEELLWNGTPVKSEARLRWELEGDVAEEVVVKLKTIRVRVLDVLGQSVPGAEVLLVPVAARPPSLSPLALRPTVVLQHSVYVFERVPAEPKDYVVVVRVQGREVVSETITITRDLGEVVLRCSALVLPGGYVVTRHEVPLLLAVVLLSAALAVVAVKYVRLRRLRSMIVEATPGTAPEARRSLAYFRRVLPRREGGQRLAVGETQRSRGLAKVAAGDGAARLVLRPPVKVERYGDVTESEEYEEVEELFE